MLHNNEIKLVVFDMVGTTIQDRGEVSTAFREALKTNGMTIEDEELQKWRGASKKTVLRHVVEEKFGPENPNTEKVIERTYANFRQHLESNYVHQGVSGIPGVETVFAWLRERRIKIALTTGFYRKVTDIIMKSMDWYDGGVDATICGDDVTQGRPAPFMIFRAMEATGVTSVHPVIKVGDTVFDLQAGVNAGLRRVVGVLSGSQNVEQLSTVLDTHIIKTVVELPELIENTFSANIQ